MNEPKLKYPVGIQTFSEIRNEGYIYIDKTAMIYQLVTSGKYIFLSRPRRFGKSLLLSTIQAYFEGRRDLFKGLDVDKLENQWNRYPVISISLAQYNPSQRNLESVLYNQIEHYEKIYGKLRNNPDLGVRFGNLIQTAYEQTGQKAVILIDEYDAPMVAHLGEEKRHAEVRNLLKSVYSNLKDQDAYIKFAMLTGVSKFSKMSIFSGLNNLKDISMLPSYSTICGITEQELRSGFTQGISQLGQALNLDYEGALHELKNNYDGYHFTRDCPDLYNPFSLLNSLQDSMIEPYWFRTASPTFLVKRLAKERGSLASLLNDTVSSYSIDDIESYGVSPLALLFQTGYLTIKGYDPRRKRYRLGIPNKEVESGLFTELLSYTAELDKNKIDARMWDIRDAFNNGNPELGLNIIKSVFAAVPPSLSNGMPEIYYENNLYMLFMLVGLDARAEWWTSNGRIDMLLEVPDYIYVMELKLDGTPEQALEQIERKEYALQWKYDGREVYKIGINYSKATRNIDRWIITQPHSISGS